MATYTYLFADLRSGVVINELALYGTSFARELNKFGDWTGTIGLDNETMRNKDIKDCTIPGRTAIYVDRDGVIVYAGVVWTRTYASQGKTIQLTGQDLSSYFNKRFISGRFATRDFIQTDQLAIAQSLLNQAQAAVGGDIGVIVPSNTSGRLRDRSYPGNELKPVAEAISQAADNIDGYDWEIDASYNTDMSIIKSARFGYPYLGRAPQGTDLVWDYPGSITEYWWSESASDGASSMWAVGAGDGDTALMGVADNNTLLSNGYPILESQNSYSDVSIQDTIDGHAQEDLRNAPMPVLSPTIHVRADIEPVFGSYDLGDHAKFVIVDPWFEEQFTVTRRIMGWRLTPSSSSEMETVDLTTAVPYGG